MKKLLFVICSVLSVGVLGLGVLAQSFVSTYKMRLRTILTGLNNPILIRNAKDGSKRLFVVQQSGLIKVLQPGSSVPSTFIDLSSKILFAGDERGLLGMTFHPSFSSNGKFYVYYNRAVDGTIVVSEYRVTGNPNQGDITTERILLTIPHPNSNHNGGMIEFGPDDYLYLGTGDGGSANDPPGNGQNRSVILGKILRIDPNAPVGSPNPYLIPPTNPFIGVNTARCDNGSTTPGITCQEIWAYGMRNPWRWSFDRGGTNQLYVADVGQGAIEELDIVTAGGNYGWRVYEGTQCTGLDPNLCAGGSNPITQIPPFFQYTHLSGRCAVTGGYVYRGTQGSLPFGAYIFADYCSGEIWQWQNNTQTLLQDTPRLITSFGEDEDGEIYVCYQNGQIDKVTRAKAPSDFDGDAKTDLSVFRPSNGVWYSINSTNGATQLREWGAPSDIPTPGDFDGDNVTDFAVFRPSLGLWFVIRSSDGTIVVEEWGLPGDIPVAGDYDGDSITDFAIYRGGLWYILRSSDSNFNVVEWGTPTDHVAPADFDGDAKTDICVYRDSIGGWFSVNSSDGKVRFTQWGEPGDISAPGDFDGDGRADLAISRPSANLWYVIRSSNNTIQIVEWGMIGDKPEVADFDGDGQDDFTIWRPESGVWYVRRSSDGQVTIRQWGETTDIPTPAFDSR